ncbi:MAG: hypothetical protein ACYTFK_02000 [Planctomycetota bacterium]|jgi:hypothetical protein
MNEKNNIEKRLEELGREISKSDSIADKVMHQINSPEIQNPRPYSAPVVFALRQAGKWAVAAVLLILAGYAVGRFTGPGVDVDRLSANLTKEMTQQWRAELAANYIQLKEELNRQHQKDLNSFALQTLTASTTSTNQLLIELIQSINAAQAQDRQWVMEALNQVESNRLADTVRFRNGLQSLAVLTGDEFARTRQGMAQLLVNRPEPGTVEEE